MADRSELLNGKEGARLCDYMMLLMTSIGGFASGGWMPRNGKLTSVLSDADSEFIEKETRVLAFHPSTVQYTWTAKSIKRCFSIPAGIQSLRPDGRLRNFSDY